VNLKAAEGCQAYTCTLLRRRNLPVLYFKNSMETINLMLAVYFLWLLRTKEISSVTTKGHQHKGSYLRNRLVRSILLAEICVSMLPTYITFTINLLIVGVKRAYLKTAHFFSQTVGINAAAYVGGLLLVCMGTNAVTHD